MPEDPCGSEAAEPDPGNRVERQVRGITHEAGRRGESGGGQAAGCCTRGREGREPAGAGKACGHRQARNGHPERSGPCLEQAHVLQAVAHPCCPRRQVLEAVNDLTSSRVHEQRPLARQCLPRGKDQQQDACAPSHLSASEQRAEAEPQSFGCKGWLSGGAWHTADRCRPRSGFEACADAVTRARVRSPCVLATEAVGLKRGWLAPLRGPGTEGRRAAGTAPRVAR
mmetsp:Transcript_8144/g.19185  ORF Transcript_8144/g.19185 Transcript_8144/m.19185 type:complete len:226 (-) Transcript_8144:96-773(-)